MKNPLDIAVRWRVRRELRTLLPLETATLEASIVELEKTIEKMRLEFDQELSLLRRAVAMPE